MSPVSAFLRPVVVKWRWMALGCAALAGRKPIHTWFARNRTVAMLFLPVVQNLSQMRTTCMSGVRTTITNLASVTHLRDGVTTQWCLFTVSVCTVWMYFLKCQTVPLNTSWSGFSSSSLFSFAGNVKFNTTEKCGGLIEVNYRNKWEKVCTRSVSPQRLEELCQKLNCGGYSGKITNRKQRVNIALHFCVFVCLWQDPSHYSEKSCDSCLI